MQVLPHVLADRRQRLQAHESTVMRDTTRQMAASVQQLHASAAGLRQCSDAVEGSVLVLGVRTAHRLITQLTTALDAIETVKDAWRTTSAAQQDLVVQYRQLMASMDQAYTGLKERRDAAERELRALRTERDRKEQAYDTAVTYVQRVLAEHTHWQDTHGHNTQRWPVVEACDDALAALHTARAGPTAIAVGGADRRSRRDGDDAAPHATRDDEAGGSAATPAAEAKRSQSGGGAGPPPLREWAAAQPATASGGAAEEGAAVALRWASTMAGRLSSTQPSLQFAYVPPADEVALLREVLAMGTGSTTLMRDIEQANARLDDRRARLRSLCVRTLSTVQVMRQELCVLKSFLRGLQSQRAPFAAAAEELVLHITTFAEHQARRRATSVASITAPTAAMTSDPGRTSGTYPNTAAPSLAAGSIGSVSQSGLVPAHRVSTSSGSYTAAQSSDGFSVPSRPVAAEGWAWPNDS